MRVKVSYTDKSDKKHFEIIEVFPLGSSQSFINAATFQHIGRKNIKTLHYCTLIKEENDSPNKWASRRVSSTSNIPNW